MPTIHEKLTAIDALSESKGWSDELLNLINVTVKACLPGEAWQASHEGKTLFWWAVFAAYQSKPAAFKAICDSCRGKWHELSWLASAESGKNKGICVLRLAVYAARQGYSEVLEIMLDVYANKFHELNWQAIPENGGQEAITITRYLLRIMNDPYDPNPCNVLYEALTYALAAEKFDANLPKETLLGFSPIQCADHLIPMEFHGYKSNSVKSSYYSALAYISYIRNMGKLLEMNEQTIQCIDDLLSSLTFHPQRDEVARQFALSFDGESVFCSYHSPELATKCYLYIQPFYKRYSDVQFKLANYYFIHAMDSDASFEERDAGLAMAYYFSNITDEYDHNDHNDFSRMIIKAYLGIPQLQQDTLPTFVLMSRPQNGVSERKYLDALREWYCNNKTQVNKTSAVAVSAVGLYGERTRSHPSENWGDHRYSGRPM